MTKKYWFIIIIVAILTAIFYWYFNYFSHKISLPESPEKKIESGEKSFQTIELEKPPFIKD